MPVVIASKMCMKYSQLFSVAIGITVSLSYLFDKLDEKCFWKTLKCDFSIFFYKQMLESGTVMFCRYNTNIYFVLLNYGSCPITNRFE